MAFLQYSDIAIQLGHVDESTATLALFEVEECLKNFGLVFTPPVEDVYQIFHADNAGRHDFTIDFIKDIVKVEIYNTTSNTAHTISRYNDYMLISHEYFTSYYDVISLTNVMYQSEELHITCKRGLFVDFNDDTDALANIIRAAVVQYIKYAGRIEQADTLRQMGFENAETGDSKVKMSTTTSTTTQRSSFIDSPYFEPLSLLLL